MSPMQTVPHIIGQSPLCPFALSPRPHPLAALRAPDYFSDAVAGFLFESHWLWWLAIFGVAAALYFVGQTRGDKRPVHVALIVAAVTALWLVLALAFDSPGERLYAAHRGLANAAAAHDPDRLLTYLAPDFRAPILDITGDTPTRERVNYYLNQYGIKDTYITAYKFTRATKTAATDVTFVTTSNAGPIKTTWRLSWDDLPGQDWRIVRAELLRVGDQPLERNAVIP